MRTVKNLIAGAILTIYTLLVFKGSWRNYLGEGVEVVFFIIYFVVGLSIFNFVVRKSLFFKPYFTSKFNVLCSGHKSQFEIDIPEDLLFDKLIEVIQDSSYRMGNVDRGRLLILATSSVNWISWGENIYIELSKKRAITQVTIYSVSVVGVYDWGRNEFNSQKMMMELEESLTV